MKLLYNTLICFFAVFSLSTAQNTVGLLSYNPNQSFDGYNLIYPHNQSNVYLLDNCGEIVHSWEGDVDTRPANMAYLLEDGRLVKTVRPSSITGDPIWAGGGGATIEIRDWDNNLEWSYTLNNADARLHHDIAVIETGTDISILAVAWESKSLDEVIEAGRDTSVLESDQMWPDYVFEINPATDEIIWEWHAWDHLAQDFDETKSNYVSDISTVPNKIDINYDFDGSGDPDWMHVNAIDYDPINDMVMLCVPNFHEVWILDHSTSTANAATGFGGKSGVGGDLMYRWGNDAAFGSGGAGDQTLFFPHDAHFVDDFIDPLDPMRGSIGIFNNRVGATYSTANFFKPSFDMYDYAFGKDQNVFLPNDFTQTIVHPVDSSLMYSTGLSSVQLLPNSNLLVCVGRYGYSFEMTQNNDIVWEYKTPIAAGLQATQGDTLAINNNLTFRTKRYPLDYEAFNGKDLSQKGWIEISPDSSFCDKILPTFDLTKFDNLNIYPNPASDLIMVDWSPTQQIQIEILDVLGRTVYSKYQNATGRAYIDLSSFEEGFYFFRIDHSVTKKIIISKN